MSIVLAVASLTSAIGLSLKDSFTETASTSVHHSNGETTTVRKTLWESNKSEAFGNAALISVLPLAVLAALYLTFFKDLEEYRFVPVGIGAFSLVVSAIFILSASWALVISSALMFAAGLTSLAVRPKMAEHVTG